MPRIRLCCEGRPEDEPPLIPVGLVRRAALSACRGERRGPAAIAAQLVLGLVEPQSSGRGGGAFLVYYNAKTDRLTPLDASQYDAIEDAVMPARTSTGASRSADGTQ